MGHIRLGNLPRTRKWQQVIALIEGGAGTAQIANATITAAEKCFKLVAEDKGLVETIWILTQLPLAAKSDDFGAGSPEYRFGCLGFSRSYGGNWRILRCHRQKAGKQRWPNGPGRNGTDGRLRNYDPDHRKKNTKLIWDYT